MSHNRIFSPRFLALLPLLAVLIVGLACGGAEDTTTLQPTATPAPTPTPVDVAAIATGLQEVIKGSVEEALREQAGAADEPISREDLQRLVESAVEASVPPGTSPIEIQRMVQEAVEASAQPGLSRDEVADLVAQRSGGVRWRIANRRGGPVYHCHGRGDGNTSAGGRCHLRVGAALVCQ